MGYGKRNLRAYAHRGQSVVTGFPGSYIFYSTVQGLRARWRAYPLPILFRPIKGLRKFGEPAVRGKTMRTGERMRAKFHKPPSGGEIA